MMKSQLAKRQQLTAVRSIIVNEQKEEKIDSLKSRSIPKTTEFSVRQKTKRRDISKEKREKGQVFPSSTSQPVRLIRLGKQKQIKERSSMKSLNSAT